MINSNPQPKKLNKLQTMQRAPPPEGEDDLDLISVTGNQTPLKEPVPIDGGMCLMHWLLARC